MLDKLTKMISVGTVLLVVLGAFNLQQRYFWYNVRVTDYLDPSEILLSFTDVLMTIILAMVLVGLILAGVIGGIAGNLAVNKPGTVITIQTLFDTANWNKIGCVGSSITVLFSIVWAGLIAWLYFAPEKIPNVNAIWLDAPYIIAVGTGLVSNFALNRQSTKPQTFESATFLWSTLMSFAVLFATRNYLSWSAKDAGIPKMELTLTYSDESMFVSNKKTIYVEQTSPTLSSCLILKKNG